MAAQKRREKVMYEFAYVFVLLSSRKEFETRDSSWLVMIDISNALLSFTIIYIEFTDHRNSRSQ